VLNANSGLVDPRQGEDGPYHQQLKIALLSGMKPDICQIIKETLIGWGTDTLAEVKRYAIHHEHNGKEKKTKKEQTGAEHLFVTLGEIAGKILRRKGENRECRKWIEPEDRNCYNCRGPTKEQ
jgi:hypothetical protein